ncbi:hypothetical protein BST96_10570 [Oceanicoccus sagamiensis]|uniref:PEP-CTERM system TPR-repeat protein PrsT n=2 Tax=Oceanicoccus sagamiensis TaxID=716816 RepID=A0A1X9NBV8_9GAMM|nr:hypothetical protein BST96_10570 [Oceanicoccus sagamiensis]
MSQGQYRAAIIEARNVIKYSPDSAQGHLVLATIYSNLGSSPAVIKTLEPLSETYTNEVSLPLAKAYSQVGKYQSASKMLENTDQQSIEAMLVRARIEGGLNHVESAEKIYLDLLAKDASNAEAQLAYIQLQLRNQKNQSANLALNKLLQQDPNNPEALLYKAELAYLDNQLDDTENYLTQALQHLPETDIMTSLKSTVLSRLAQTLTELGRPSESLIYTKILAEANPEAHQARQQYNEALGLYQSGDIEQAEELLIELYENNPGNSMSGMLLGIINLQQGDLEEAGKLLEENIDAETSSSQAISSTALTQLRLRKPKQAVELLEKALLSHPEDAGIQAVYGLALLNIDNTDTRAALALQKALAIDPTRYKLHTILARHYLALDKNEQAYAQYNAALEKAPNSQDIKDDYINALLNNGEQDKALQLNNRFIQQNPEDPKAYLQAARINSINKDLAAAEKNLNKTISLAPDNAAALLALGQLQLAEKKPSKAINNFRKSLAVKPSTAGYKGLITGYQLNNDGDKVISELSTEAEASPDNSTLHTVLAEYYAIENQGEMALKFADSAIDSKPISNYTRSTAINIYRTQSLRSLADGDIATGRNRLSKAIVLAPNNGILQAELIKLEIQAQNFDEAMKIAEQIEQSEQGSVAGKYFKAQVRAEQQQWPEAISHIQKAWEQSPSGRIGSLYYTILKKSGNAEKAMSLLDDWISKIPQSSNPVTLKAIEFQKDGDNNAAADLYGRAIKLNPKDGIALNNLAWLYYEKGDERAEETASQAYATVPNSPGVLDTYGWILVQKGKVAEGIKLLERAESLTNGKSKEISQHLKEAEALL